MSKSYVYVSNKKDYLPWKQKRGTYRPHTICFEITARCNNNCRHCYINLPSDDHNIIKEELSFNEIERIIDEAMSIGVYGCLLTGGEPLIREDFIDIYLWLKKRGMLVSIYTNATLITDKHISLFRKYPPRNIEVSVYGITKNTYERVSRQPGSFNNLIRGINLLLKNEIKVRLKSMALRSNVHEFNSIANFCRERTQDYFRFDPFLHLRYDHNAERNEEIKNERLSPKEIVDLEISDNDRFNSLKKNCYDIFKGDNFTEPRNRLFRCGIGRGSFSIGYEGSFKLCSSLQHPSLMHNLKEKGLREIWNDIVPKVLNMYSNKDTFLKNCALCKIIDFCMCCPANSLLETNELDAPVEYFCEVAHARSRAIHESKNSDEAL